MKRWYSRSWTEYETVKDNDAKADDVKKHWKMPFIVS